MEAHGFETKTYDNQVFKTRFTRLGKQTNSWNWSRSAQLTLSRKVKYFKKSLQKLIFFSCFNCSFSLLPFISRFLSAFLLSHFSAGCVYLSIQFLYKIVTKTGNQFKSAPNSRKSRTLLREYLVCWADLISGIVYIFEKTFCEKKKQKNTSFFSFCILSFFLPSSNQPLYCLTSSCQYLILICDYLQ